MPPVVPANKSREDTQKREKKLFKKAKKMTNKNKGFLTNFSNTMTNMMKSLKDKVNGIHWFRHIFGIGKRKHTGRIGAKILHNNDAIENLTEQNEAYFNPFENMDGERGFSYSEDEEVSNLQQAFRNRVYAQKKLANENDFEDKYYDDDAKTLDFMSLYGGTSFLKKETDAYQAPELIMDTYDAEQEFEPDKEVKEGTPSKYKIAIRSQIGLQNYFIEVSNRYTKTKSKGKDKTNEVRSKEKEDALRYAVQNSPEYKEAVAIGKAQAKAAGMTYDPVADPNLWMIQEMAEPVYFEEHGHATVALRAYDENDRELSSYSFGFIPGRGESRGAAGVRPGVVKNPDPGPNAYSRLEPITYSGYLKAAAKIRGIKGSARSYSLIGYNCTSFVQDIAKESGVNIPEEESTADMITNISESHRLDSPYSLALWIKKQNLKDMERESGEDYTSLLKSPMIREARGGVERLLGAMISEESKEADEQDAFAKMKDRWLAKFRENKAIPEGVKFEKVIGFILDMYKRIVKADSVLKDDEREITSVEEEKEYFDKVKEIKAKMLETFGTVSLVSFVDQVCESEKGYEIYKRLQNTEEAKVIAEEAKKKKERAEKEAQISQMVNDRKERAKIFRDNVHRISEEDEESAEIDFGDFEDVDEYNDDELDSRTMQEYQPFFKKYLTYSSGYIWSRISTNLMKEYEATLGPEEGALILSYIVEREPYAQRIVKNMGELNENNMRRQSGMEDAFYSIRDILGFGEDIDASYQGRVKMIRQHIKTVIFGKE